MKYNNLFLLLCLLFIGFSATAQKSKFKSFTIKDTNIPSQPIKSDYKTYTVRIEDKGLNLMKFGLTTTGLTGYLKGLSKYKYGTGESDFAIVVNLFGDNEIGGKVDSYAKKTGTGDNAKTETKFRFEYQYRIPLKIELKDASGNIFKETTLSGYDDLYTIKKDGFANRAAAKAALDSKAAEMMRKELASKVNKKIKDYYDSIKAEIDVYTYPTTVSVYTIKKEEKHKMIGFDKQVELVEAALNSKLWGTESMATIQPSMDFWKSQLEKYDPSNKKEFAPFFSSSYNLSIFYILNNQFDEANTLIEKLEAIKEKKMLVNGLRRSFNYKLKCIEANK